MDKLKYKTIGLYDARKNAETGSGYRGTTIKIEGLSETELKRRITEIKSKQKKLNDEYRAEKKAKLIASRPKPPIDVMIENASLISRDIFKVHKGLTLKLDPRTGNTTFLLGSSKAGKSTALMKIYDKYYAKKKYISILFSINKHIRVYKGHKFLLRCPSFNKDAEKIVLMGKYINSKCRNKYSFVNIFDDMIDTGHNKLLNNMILTYRNSNISSLISLQYTYLLSKKARSNINNILLFHFNTDEGRKTVVETFLRATFAKMGYKTMNEQINLYKKLTSNYQFIYLHPASGHFSIHKFRL